MKTALERSAGTADDRAYRPDPFWCALGAAVFTWPLLFVGGLVTTFRVGMAVPDWPTTFGINMFLFDMRNAAWGVFIEHGHRLYGAAVGFFTLMLAIEFLVAERRKTVKALGLLALLAVIAQGVLGGVRVLRNSTALAAIHGVSGQAVFCLLTALVVLTGKTRLNPPTIASDAARIRARALLGAGLIALQVMTGSWLRHFAGRDSLILHGLLAIAVVGYVFAWIRTVERRKSELAVLLPASRALAACSTIQVVLGVSAAIMLWPMDGYPRPVSNAEALVRTGHQANGALLLASSVVLVLRSFGSVVPEPGELGETPAPSGPLGLEGAAT